MKELILDFMGMRRSHGDNLRLQHQISAGKTQPNTGHVIITSKPVPITLDRNEFNTSYHDMAEDLRMRCQDFYVTNIKSEIEGESVHYAVTTLPI